VGVARESMTSLSSDMVPPAQGGVVEGAMLTSVRASLRETTQSPHEMQYACQTLVRSAAVSAAGPSASSIADIARRLASPPP